VVREGLAAAETADLVVLGATGHGRSSRGALGQTARAAAGRARAPVLLLSRGARPAGGAVVAVDDGTPAGTRALAAARRLAPADRAPAIVCTPDGRAPAIVDAIARLGGALAVLPATEPPPPGGVVDRLLAAGVAVLLVR
jgi:nucleotide-binding universal stress UspA family protein